jgi:transposase
MSLSREEKHAEDSLWFCYPILARFLDKSTDAKGKKPMQMLYRRCCGIDVHKKMIVACLLLITSEGVRKEIQTFTTMVSDLFGLRDWLKAQHCEAVAMESTGVYWKCLWNVLEGEMELLLCNAQHMKAVPGRKTDIKDAEWIADLLHHGLLRARFVPARPQRELRDLTRYRSSLAADRARLVNRIQKTLEDTTIKLASVASDITGKSARAILEALLAGEHDPERLADLAEKRMKGKREQLVLALQGKLSDHHRFLLASQLRQVDFFDQQIREIDQEVAHRLGLPSDPSDPELASSTSSLPAKEEMLNPPETAEGSSPPVVQPDSPQPLSSAQAIHILDEVPGINVRVGAIVLAELGLCMDRFPDEAHLARLCRAVPSRSHQCQQTIEH